MQPGLTQGNFGGKRLFDNAEVLGKVMGKDESAHDGPARVVKPKDWGAVQDVSLKDFSLSAFDMPGRVVQKPDAQALRIAEMTKEAKDAAVTHKRMLDKAIKDGALAAQAAQERGREEGLREGEQIAKHKYDQVLDTLQKNTRGLLDAVGKEKVTLFLEFEGQALELVSGCIHRVFEGLAAAHSEAVLPLLKRAVTAIGEASSVTIKVHADDFQTVEGNKSFWLPVNASLKDIRVVSDNRISKGGCFVESDSTSVSAHAQEMADRIDEELKRVFMAKLQSIRNQQVTGNAAQVIPELGDEMPPEYPGETQGEPSP
jgi:flagellar biosynthesis/type III secretory pathway protein FliH